MPTVRKRAAASSRARTRPANVLVPRPPVSLAEFDRPPTAATPPKPAKAKKAKSRAAPRATKKRAAAKRKQAPVKHRAKTNGKPPQTATATPAVIALPYCPEPLVEADPAIDLAAWSALAPLAPATTPLPRNRALAHRRGSGLLTAIANWLGSRAQLGWRKLEQTRFEATPTRKWRLGKLAFKRGPDPDDELLRLRAENERLRLQLEALLALQSGVGGNQAHIPA